MDEMSLAKLAETARKMMADSGLNTANVSVRVQADADNYTRVTYSAYVGEYGSGIHEVGDSLEDLVEVITPQLVEMKDQHLRKVRDLHAQAKSLGYAVVPVGSGAAVSGVAVLESGE